MELVVDANILFAALIRNATTAKLLFRGDLQIYAPELILEEFRAYREVILAKSKEADIDTAVDLFRRLVTIVPREEFADRMEEAKSISPDPKDVPYLALALKLDIPLWSQDRALKERQTAVRVVTTAELANT